METGLASKHTTLEVCSCSKYTLFGHVNAGPWTHFVAGVLPRLEMVWFCLNAIREALSLTLCSGFYGAAEKEPTMPFS